MDWQNKLTINTVGFVYVGASRHLQFWNGCNYVYLSLGNLQMI